MREPPKCQTLVDEMAVTLCAVPELGDDAACLAALDSAGFPAWRIRLHLRAARARARAARAAEADLWHALLERP